MSEKIKGKIIASSPKAVYLDTEIGQKWIPFYSLWWPKNYTIEICISDKIAKDKGFITEEEYNERAGFKQDNSDEQSDLPF